MGVAKTPRQKLVARSRRDLEFICRQIIRFSKMPHKQLFAYLRKHRNDVFCTIRRPDGRGHIQVGMLAWRKFGALADSVIEIEPMLPRRVEREEVKKAVIDCFVRMVLEEKRELDLTTCERLLEQAANKLKQSLRDSEHYLPCVLFMHGGPDEFSVGPVTFVRRRKFFRDRKQALRRSASVNEAAHIDHVNAAVARGFPKDRSITAEGSRKLVRGLQARAIKTYRGYPWVARVRIVNCDKATSENLAAKAVETALHVIRIILGAYYTRRVRLAWSRGDALRTAGLWADGQDVIHVQTGGSSIGPVGFENWHDGLMLGGGYELKVFGSALAPLADPREIYHLHARFIDAINWFGDAATDPEPTASVVKYASAIERLLFGKYEQGRGKAFANRVKLIFDSFECDGRNQAYQDALKVYEMRSALLHGSSSPRDMEAQRLAVVAERLSRLCLLCATQLYPMMRRAYADPGPEKLEEVMKRLAQEGLEPLAAAAGFRKTSPSVQAPSDG